VFDPNYTGAGAQPSYFDNWANMCNSYVVLSSRIKLEIMTSTAAAAGFVMTGVFPAYNTAVPTAAVDGSSMRYAKAVSTIAVGNAVKDKLDSSMSTAQMFGVRQQAVVDDDLYSAVVSTNPAAAQTWYWTIFCQVESGTATLSGTIRVVLEYDVKFFDPAVVNLSTTRRLTPKPRETEQQQVSAASAAAAAESVRSLPSCMVSPYCTCAAGPCR